MLSQLLSKLVNFFYRVEKIKQQYGQEYPLEKIVMVAGCKGITTSLDQAVEHGVSWVKAQRAVFLLTDKKVVCGKWQFLLEDIVTAELLKIRGGQVLKITTKDEQHYQFGMQVNRELEEQTVLPLIIKKGKVKYSLFSIVIRLFLLVILLKWLYLFFK